VAQPEQAGLRSNKKLRLDHGQPRPRCLTKRGLRYTSCAAGKFPRCRRTNRRRRCRLKPGLQTTGWNAQHRVAGVAQPEQAGLRSNKKLHQDHGQPRPRCLTKRSLRQTSCAAGTFLRCRSTTQQGRCRLKPGLQTTGGNAERRGGPATHGLRRCCCGCRTGRHYRDSA
jgi:hypothetical protein